MTLQITGTVLRNDRIKSFYYLLELYCPPIAIEIKPGQFIMLKVSDSYDPLLRRPFSIYKSYSNCNAEKEKRGRFSILYKKVGKGTQRMTTFRKGQEVDLIGPLGHGFTLPAPSSNPVLIGGGVGIVSLYSLAEMSKAKKPIVLIGGKTRNDIICLEDFKRLTSSVLIATEDGSLGFRGTVIDLFLSYKKQFKKNRSYSIYSCGPVEMLRELAKGTKTDHFISEASFESRMGCGFGACWGCTVKTNDPQTPYQRVCQEGPVFNLKNIIWE
jgi:dihydroorotate dehydrogenase electron transfer subunit